MSENTLQLSPTSRRKTLLGALAGGVGLVAVASGAYWFFYGAHFVSTDNAYAAVEVAQVTPSVGGTISEVLVTDTQAVKQGDILVRIDPTDATLALAQAEADLARAVRRVKGFVANDGSLAAQIAAREADEKRAAAALSAAEADFERARIDLDRRQALAASGSVSGDELTRATNAFAAAQANLDASRAVAAQAKANRSTALSSREANAVLIANATEETNPEVTLARARRDQAAVDLERTVVRAPVDGIVAKRTVQLGQRVQAGMPLLAVVPVQEMHVDANFKEVQLENVHPGQPVKLHADLYGGGVTYHGIVEGFSGGSGAAFSAIPAQNATGNWIKVVQRLPVRIKLDPGEIATHPLKVGLSMTAEIDTRKLN
ncbi:HlyD family secretion protein [Propionivibrio dicarboxylicus]|uniref:Membrane fusion protein, multidrug efflux system n=1 Tax=Propionivibrio dicarboxylicus TaxID=83767 RepID=A0A1G8GYY0_9RHOO|nr:HlyD family secretion protein [Propionivibrio dicarboxylicus]SDH99598.1 membrane fusion protein, multidrug efflux system [Propionivibrio dicarboxylicus]